MNDPLQELIDVGFLCRVSRVNGCMVVIYNGRQYKVWGIDHHNGNFWAYKAQKKGGIYHTSPRFKTHVLPMIDCLNL